MDIKTLDTIGKTSAKYSCFSHEKILITGLQAKKISDEIQR